MGSGLIKFALFYVFVKNHGLVAGFYSMGFCGHMNIMNLTCQDTLFFANPFSFKG